MTEPVEALDRTSIESGRHIGKVFVQTVVIPAARDALSPLDYWTGVMSYLAGTMCGAIGPEATKAALATLIDVVDEAEQKRRARLS